MWDWSRKKAEPMAEPQSPGEKKFEMAMAAANDFLVRTKSVRAQLEPFRSADDPFAAIQRSTALDGFYQ